MGKKPLATIVGLVWAGIALTGCGECCRMCRSKNCTAPAVASNPTSTGGAVTQTPPMIGDARTNTPAYPASRLENPSAPMGYAESSHLQQTGATMPASTVPMHSPTTQNSLSLPPDNNPNLSRSLPPRIDDGLDSMPGQATSAAGESRRMPPVPVMPRTLSDDTVHSAQSPGMMEPNLPSPPASTHDLPPLSDNVPPPPPMPGESLPPLSSGSSLPPLPQ